MKDFIHSLKLALEDIDNKWGGDVTFIKPIQEKDLNEFESSINWKLPQVFRYFYTKETNGIIIDSARIYSIYNKEQKKNLGRKSC